MNKNIVLVADPVAVPSSTATTAESNGYLARCHACEARFDAMTARWCDCLKPLRTIECASCRACFCTAPLPYKRQFWERAPRELREDVRRFRVQIGTHATPIIAPPEGVHRPTVMVVDDDEAMRSLVSCFVEQLGYHTVSAGDPEEALAMNAVHYVDVVITDALMPKMDGREFCRRLKSTPDGATRKVILMTSVYKARHFRNEALGQYGVDAYLNKPLDFDLLATTLAEYAPLTGHLTSDSRLMQSLSEGGVDHSEHISPEQRKQSA